MARTFDPFREIFGEAPRTVGMPMDLVRTGDDFVVSIDLPGVDPSSIDIDAEERTLTIRATRNTQTADGQWLVRERPTGTFARQLTLGNGLALDRVKAGYQDGVLTLHIPVAEEAKPRKIQVSHTGGQQSIEGEVAESSESSESIESQESVSV